MQFPLQPAFSDGQTKTLCKTPDGTSYVKKTIFEAVKSRTKTLSACLTVRSLYLNVSDGRPVVSRYVVCVPSELDDAGKGTAN